MDEQKLLKISLMCIVFGISILYILSLNSLPQNYFDSSKFDEKVLLKGEIINKYTSNKSASYTIHIEKLVKAVQFNPNVELNIGEKVEIIAKKSNQDLIIEEIRIT